MFVTPLYTDFAYKQKLWKKPAGRQHKSVHEAVLAKLDLSKIKQHIPTMAGVIFIFSVSLITLTANLNRSETWLPLAGFLGAGLVGVTDDLIAVRILGKGAIRLPSRVKHGLIIGIATIGGWWFYSKLGVSAVHIPFMSLPVEIGWLIVPLFVLVVVATASAVSLSDGLDGLAGGLSCYTFSTYSIIALLQGRYGVAGFCMSVVGALLSYTWFNIYPARFFMGSVGSFSLGTALGIIAMLTDTVALLPIIGLVFAAEAGSVILQILSKHIRNGKKLFRIAPIHYHFIALGWPETKVTMRFWVIGQVSAVAGLVLFLTGKYL